MKFTASFAILAAVVSQAVVYAAPMPVQYESALEARADFTDGALEDVWSRYYDELLEEVEAREDEEVFARGAAMSSLAKDIGSNLGQKSPGYAKQYTQSKNAQIRNSLPRAPFVTAHQQSHSKKSSGRKRSLDADEEVFERGSAFSSLAKDVGSNLGQKSPGYAKQYSQSKNAQIRNSQPRAPFVTAHQQSRSKKSSSSSSRRKRSLDNEEEIFERGAAMSSFAKDIGSNLGQKSPGYAKQYTQSKNAQIRNSLPRAPFVTAHQQSHSKKSSGRKRSLDGDEEVFERGAAMSSLAKDIGSNLGQKSPGYAKQYTNSKNAQIRNSLPRAPFVTAHQQSHSKKSSGRKRSLDADEEMFERGAAMSSLAKDIGSNLGQKSPGYAKQYTQSKNAQIRNSLPRAPFVTAHQQSHSKKSSGRKRSLDVEEEIFEDVL